MLNWMTSQVRNLRCRSIVGSTSIVVVLGTVVVVLVELVVQSIRQFREM